MLDFLFSHKRSPIAIDIGADSIKMLQMHRVGGVVGVCACGRWRFPQSAPAEPAQRREMIVSAVREMLRNGGFRGRRVSTVLRCDELGIKNVRLPHMPETELAEAVRWEARERFGFEVGADQLAYINAGEIRAGGEIRDEIVLLAVAPETLQGHLDLLDELKLAPEHVDAEPVALFRTFERFLRRRVDEQAVTVLVDMGLLATRVIVARGRQIVFIKSIDIGGKNFNEAVSKRLNLSVEEARDLRLRSMFETSTPEGTPESEPDAAPTDRAESVSYAIRDAIRSEAEALGREIGLCLRYCSVTFRGLRPDRITLVGGEAYDPAARELLSENLQMECRLGQPLKNVDVSGADLGSDRRGMLSEWAVCTGLALRYVDVANDMQEGDHGEHRLSA